MPLALQMFPSIPFLFATAASGVSNKPAKTRIVTG